MSIGTPGTAREPRLEPDKSLLYTPRVRSPQPPHPSPAHPPGRVEVAGGQGLVVVRVGVGERPLRHHCAARVRLSSARLGFGSVRLGSDSIRFGSVRFGSARLGLGSARLGLGPARLRPGRRRCRRSPLPAPGAGSGPSGGAEGRGQSRRWSGPVGAGCVCFREPCGVKVPCGWPCGV